MDGTEWTTSDHSIIKGNISTQIRRRSLLVTDWEQWSDFIRDEDKNASYPDPIRSLKAMDLKACKFHGMSPDSPEGFPPTYRIQL